MVILYSRTTVTVSFFIIIIVNKSVCRGGWLYSAVTHFFLYYSNYCK
jgi:hypothetical protein